MDENFFVAQSGFGEGLEAWWLAEAVKYCCVHLNRL
jgi:hypothetical protein